MKAGSVRTGSKFNGALLSNVAPLMSIHCSGRRVACDLTVAIVADCGPLFKCSVRHGPHAARIEVIRLTIFDGPLTLV